MKDSNKKTLIVIAIILAVVIICIATISRTGTQDDTDSSQADTTPSAPSPPVVGFKSDPNNQLPIYTTEQIFNAAMNERHGEDAIIGKKIRLLGWLRQTPMGSVLTFDGEAQFAGEPNVYIVNVSTDEPDSTLDAIHANDCVEIICVYYPGHVIRNSLGGYMQWDLIGSEFQKTSGCDSIRRFGH